MDLSDFLDDDSGSTVADELRLRRRDELMERVLSALANPQAANVTVNPQVKMPPAQVEVVVQPPEAKKPVAWTFEFERNADGTIKRIHATPKE